jgi:hypothetical protein
MFEQVGRNFIDQVTRALDLDMSYKCGKAGISYSAVRGSECNDWKARYLGVEDRTGRQVPGNLCD